MTITRIESIIDHLPAARDEALAKVLGNGTWMDRIADAYDYLLRVDEVEHYGELVLMESDTSNTVYITNGHCNCTYGKRGGMCKHRVRARLFKLALEKANAPVPEPVKRLTPAQARDHRIAWAEAMDNQPVVEHLTIEKARLQAEAEKARLALMECFCYGNEIQSK